MRTLHYLTLDRELLAKWTKLKREYPLVAQAQGTDEHDIVSAAWYLHDFEKFIELSKNLNLIGTMLSFPILTDKDFPSGSMSGQYFHTDLLVAQKIFKKNPRKLVDVGSRQDGFVAHVASFREIEVFDIRPQLAKVENVTFRQADLMRADKSVEGYCDAVSSLHAIEHFGLGRYGDPIDPAGHVKAIDNIYHILQDKGMFYFAVPIGEQRIEFNAHRVFDVEYLLELFKGKFEVVSFSFVDDGGDLHKNVPIMSPGCHYGCGIFELMKT
jgi:SAM-dependent methyltransferase